MVSTSFMVDTSSHPRAQLHRCVEKSAYDHVTYRDYEEQAWQKVQELHERLKNKSKRAFYRTGCARGRPRRRVTPGPSGIIGTA